MIIVEGMDNSGKTTLVKQLLAWNPNLKLVASEGPKDRDAMVLRCANGMIDPCAIFDRYHLFSEYVYGPVIRNHNKLAGEWTELAYLTMLNAPAVIYCRPDDDTIVAFDQRDQMPGVRQNAMALLARYDLVMEYFRNLTHTYRTGAVFRYDWREMGVQEIQEFIKSYLESRLDLHYKLQEMTFHFNVDADQETGA